MEGTAPVPPTDQVGDRSGPAGLVRRAESGPDAASLTPVE